MIRTCLLLFVCLALPAVPEQTQPACNDNTKTCRPRVKFLGRLKGVSRWYSGASGLLLCLRGGNQEGTQCLHE